MPKFYKTRFLITSVRAYSNDLAIRAFTQQLGNITIIAKNANSPNSKRKRILILGALIEGTLYYKNHYYLSEAELVENFVPQLTSSYKLILLKIILKAIEEFNNTDSENFTKLLEILNKLGQKDNTYAFAVTFAVFNELKLVFNTNLKCSSCKKRLLKESGVFYEGNLYCHKCQSNKDFTFNLKTEKNQIDFFKNILDYWSL